MPEITESYIYDYKLVAMEVRAPYFKTDEADFMLKMRHRGSGKYICGFVTLTGRPYGSVLTARSYTESTDTMSDAFKKKLREEMKAVVRQTLKVMRRL